ncbi:hypothetical protein BGAL_0022g00490 [Botrytis galanthina]|uniref:Uncharacterized protein n=1 Tax=Botrytis galanthina TaxID=278940 RepID=A0A4S8RBX9_9HELO|nr:hypothetical protein BGAL_0022g00490 [Botrytis galanthina]
MVRIYPQVFFTVVADAVEKASSESFEPQVRNLSNVRKTSIIICDFAISADKMALQRSPSTGKKRSDFWRRGKR